MRGAQAGFVAGIVPVFPVRGWRSVRGDSDGVEPGFGDPWRGGKIPWPSGGIAGDHGKASESAQSESGTARGARGTPAVRRAVVALA